jgi:membrane-associated protein
VPHADVSALPGVLDPTTLINTFGLAGLLIVIFAECGLLIGFFLPGDTLLFAAGLLVATGTWDVSIVAIAVLAPVAAVLGNVVGYWIGRQAGPKVFDRPQSRLFKPEYVTRSEQFFARFGPVTIVLARFVPIVRTVATVLAGVSRMRFGLYALYSVIGGVLWAAGVALLGYWLGHITFVRDTVEPLIDPIILAVVLISLLPTAIHLWRGRSRAARADS